MMSGKNKKYNIHEYLFDVEDYVTIGIMCDIIYPKYIWDDIFTRHYSSIWAMLSNDVRFINVIKYDDGLNFKIVYMYKVSGNDMYGRFDISQEVSNKILSYNREIKIGELCKE